MRLCCRSPRGHNMTSYEKTGAQMRGAKSAWMFVRLRKRGDGCAVYLSGTLDTAGISSPQAGCRVQMQ